MKIFLFLQLLTFIPLILSDYEKIELSYESPYYYIPLKFPDPQTSQKYILSTNLPKCFFPSTNCKRCRIAVIDSTNPNYQNSSKNISIPYYFYNFIGQEYNTNITTEKYVASQNICSFDNLTYASEYAGYGRFSLSFLNYNFDTEKKIFALKFNEEGAELHLGGYENNSQTLFNDFKAYAVNEYQNYTETIEKKIENDMLAWNNFLSENENNNHSNDTITENRTIEIDKSKWFINFTNLKIKTDSESELDYKMNSYKLTLDMSADKFYIPREFFVNNVQKIFPKDAKCQIARDGYFVCQCDEDYKTKFGSFVFENEQGTKFYVNATDYMSFQSSIYGSECEVHLVMNYDNDLFIGGITVLNNYYSVFDVDNMILKIRAKDDLNQKETTKYILAFFIVAIIAIIILFGGYFLYNKYVINDQTGLLQLNGNQNGNNNNGLNIHQIPHE